MRKKKHEETLQKPFGKKVRGFLNFFSLSYLIDNELIKNLK